MELSIQPHEFSIIGKLHARANPESATQLIAAYRQEQNKALDTDFDNLNFYFLHFCASKNLIATDYIGNVKTREKTEVRKLFIAAMIRVYKPDMFVYDLTTRGGLADRLCKLLKIDGGYMSKIVDEVRTYYNHNWQDLADQANEIAQSLVNISRGVSSGSLPG